MARFPVRIGFACGSREQFRSDKRHSTMIEKSLVGCFLHYFGKKEGQTMSDFSAEVRAAVDADRQFWLREFSAAGYKVLDA